MLDMINMFTAGFSCAVTIAMVLQRNAGLAAANALACAFNLWLALS